MEKVYRLRELDFLRGVAIVLVLLRHQFLFQFTMNMGWIGVDLFFVLSGFLVSGLLFQEHIKYGDIQPSRFLIRRGFKIYPLYYLTYFIYIFPKLITNKLMMAGVLSDLTFVQNYVIGFGYAYPATWSLAIEEHFYFGLAFILWYVFKNKKFIPETGKSGTSFSHFEKIILSLFIFCLILRILSNIFFPQQIPRNFTMTHLRIDSLLAGVLVSYWYYFKIDYFRKWFLKYKPVLYSIAILGVSWTPFIEPKLSFFAMTIGFTLLYISFGILLSAFLLNENINTRLNSLLSETFVTFISKVGFCSYSIYLIHTLVDVVVSRTQQRFSLYYNDALYFIITSAISILIGIFITYRIERFFLRMRDRHYPKRSAGVKKSVS